MNINISELIGIIGGWGIVISGLTIFISQRLSERLNNKWKQNSDIKIDQLRNDFNRKNTILNNLISFQNTSFNHSQEKRVIAVEIIWSNINYLKSKIPSPLGIIYNILTEKEIDEFLESDSTNVQITSMKNELNTFNEYEYFNELSETTKDIFKQRPFLGEELWLSYETYKAFIGRLIYRIHEDIQVNKKISHWHNDSSIMIILETYLNTDEINFIKNKKMGSLNTTLNLLDTKVLHQMNSIISGNSASENALERVIKLEKII